MNARPGPESRKSTSSSLRLGIEAALHRAAIKAQERARLQQEEQRKLDAARQTGVAKA